jgi:hypothetical protein
MPYAGASDDSLPSNVKKMPTKKKKKWVSVFNETYNSCVADGGSTGNCEEKSFKAANGAVKQGVTMAVKDRTVLHRVWDVFLDSMGLASAPEEARYDLITTEEVRKEIARATKLDRSMSMGRVHQQVYEALGDAEGGWAYPIDIYVDDNGRDIFSIVAQSGKLFRVPIAISEETVTLGEWLQVKEEFAPVSQNRFFIRRQKDGKYRWMAIAATSVLNRIGEIDSIKLFDSFIEKATKRNQYPRLDFYHYGETNPKVWEFGTADYLARDGVCYIASGTFDEGHPLAEATIRACEGSDDEWGCSIEFYAYAEAETIVVEPEIKIPVYNEGENTRISVVLEEDAAGLFTRMGVKEGVTRTMDTKTRDALEKLFGTDSDELKSFMDQFEEGVDGTNKRVKNDKLIHRAVTEDVAEEATEEDETEEDAGSEGLVLDEAAVAEITKQMVASPEMQAFFQSVNEIKTLVADSVVAREKDQQEIDQLKKSNSQLAKAVERLGKDEGLKKSEYLQDLPANKRQVVTFRPRDAHSDDEEGDLEDFTAIAQRTLQGLPSY